MERRLRSWGSFASPRMLYTSHTFHCCAPERCPNSKQALESQPGTLRLNRHSRSPLAHSQGAAAALPLSLRATTMRQMPCGAGRFKGGAFKGGGSMGKSDGSLGVSSYVGEDGSRDAYEGLMAVLAQRLAAPQPPPEPWSIAEDCLGLNDTATNQAAHHRNVKQQQCAVPRRGGVQFFPSPGWFRRRSKWANEQKHQPGLQLITVPSPASAHRAPWVVQWNMHDAVPPPRGG